MESGFANATEFTNASTVCPESNRPELPDTVNESINSGKEDPLCPLKTLSNSPLKGENSSLPLREGQGGSKPPFKGDLEGLEGQVLLRISDRKITIRDTVFIARTDTLLRTQTITQKERYIPPFYRFCTITLVTLITFVTLAFSIHLLLRYLKIRSPT